MLEECEVTFSRIARAMDVILKISTLDKLSHVVREDLLRAVVFDELLDRDANAARVLDRQRLLFEGHASGGISAYSSFQFAEKAAATIDSSISEMWSSSDGVYLKGSVLLGARDTLSNDGCSF